MLICVLLISGCLVFEGVAHPFKANLIKFNGKTYSGQGLEVLKALEREEAPTPRSESS
jgi:hypothetical protein